MSTISSLLSNLLQDYQKSVATDATAATGSTNTSADTSNSGQYGEAYVLDLSQAAQDILDSRNSNSVISLTDAQKQKLQSILDKYKDEPINSDTLAKLDADLKQAGLSPDELAIIQEAKDFNPVQVLIKILGGLSDSNDSASSTDSVLSGLSSTASGTPLGDLLEKYQSQATSESGSNSEA